MTGTTPPSDPATARLARENRRLRRQTARAKAQLVRQRGLGRLGPEALAAALDALRAEFVTNGATPAEALGLCGELEALARGQRPARLGRLRLRRPPLTRRSPPL